MQKNIEEVKKILKNHIDRLVKKYNIELMYIFGSYATNKNNENSDLDIAVYLEGEPEAFIKLEILDELVGIFDREDIDLVILNKVDIVLQFQVIKYGEIVYMKDLLTKVLYESKTMDFYMDMEYFRNVRNKIMHEKFLDIMKE
ncbi:type VII toxin-antitoxin system MntA family adenylyltransferase antitoxin [Schnuerera ultunensis]|uniref:Predicted nucleotidyltransferases n=1 Tax=[Clostridium] ultunense Esp TaxID=1288971 RepID=A0A1M4PMH8_9FIRM|nr:nucleotidyltransferase domain-containing protein [Schnuerera ultunensis]SHD76678.1 Predicted nucleotidyltransferases [[Clostridium] ultunense Esp]